MDLEHIRRWYGVPAEKGARVDFLWPPGQVQHGTIVGSADARLLVVMDGEDDPVPLHPTWKVTYRSGADT